MHIKKFAEIFESINIDKNPAIWKGRHFWIGIFDAMDGEIINTWTYEEAEEEDFHHSFYMNIEYLDKIRDNEYVVFWVDYGKEISYDDWNNKIPPHIIRKVKEQIKRIDKV